MLLNWVTESVVLKQTFVIVLEYTETQISRALRRATYNLSFGVVK
jgi:hypothetical protein